MPKIVTTDERLSEPIFTRVNQATYDRVNAICERENRSFSQIVRLLLQRALREPDVPLNSTRAKRSTVREMS